MFKGFEYKFKGSELKFKAYEHNFQHGKDTFYLDISKSFFQESFHIRLNLLKFGRELVEGVLLHHHFHLAQTVLIACHLGACLLGMNRPVTDFILPDIAQGIADALHQRANHQVEKMMTLYI